MLVIRRKRITKRTEQVKMSLTAEEDRGREVIEHHTLLIFTSCSCLQAKGFDEMSTCSRIIMIIIGKDDPSLIDTRIRIERPIFRLIGCDDIEYIITMI
jgi:hypothetical protein